MTVINVRIDEKLKKESGKVLAKLGLDMSSAIKVFLSQVVRDKELPFVPSLTPKEIRESWDKEVRDALASGGSYKNAKTMHKDILGE